MDLASLAVLASYFQVLYNLYTDTLKCTFLKQVYAQYGLALLISILSPTTHIQPDSKHGVLTRILAQI